MKRFLSLMALLPMILCVSQPAHADVAVTDRFIGRADAPVTVEEYVSLGCPHCGDFYLNTLPALEKQYADSGKVRFVLRDFPLDGLSLKAASIARCMPEDQYFAFITVLYKNQRAWELSQNPEQTLLQYAKLGGLSEEKGKECLKDTKLQDAIIAERTNATDKYNVQSTPTFIINGGAARIDGAKEASEFTAAFDRLLNNGK
ncbi:MAG: DsbA family protein [Alphaproteobacteria bacterium]|nr:DsbA family protein [Alphaproteobacteria bacterium]MBV8547870.1 DsbA family protein [Alphaproteobacteria bacterium]